MKDWIVIILVRSETLLPQCDMYVYTSLNMFNTWAWWWYYGFGTCSCL